MKVAVYDNKGVKKSDIDVKSGIFKVSGKEVLLSEVIVSYLSNMRVALPKTKKRGEVSGGGKKPWRQKGTGRARTGSTRNPIWRGGGIIFGPTGMQNHEKDIPKKKRRVALTAALTSKANEIIVLDDFALKTPKTKEANQIVQNLPIEGRTMFVFGEKDNFELVSKSFNNIQKVEVEFFKNLNAYDVLKAKNIVFVGSALDETIKFLEA